MRIPSARLCTLALLFLLAGARPLVAQTAAGSITGRIVLDSTGAAVHGATVVVIGARRTTTSGDDGKFELTNVPVGTYEVIAQREHFSAARQSVTVTAGQSANVEFTLSLAAIHENVTVTASATGTATTFESFNSITSLDALELTKNMGATVADALANAPGVAKRTFGPGSSRPIIRGFDGDRVLVMQDGVRTGDLSSQSGDHGVSIDPGSLQRLEVVKGPATLLYGSNAIGGVVNAITPQDAFRANPFKGTLGGVTFDGSSADAQVAANGNLQYGNGTWTVWGSGGSRRSGDYDTPSETIPNSATSLQTGRAGFGWTGHRGYFGASGGVERNRYGIPFAGLLEGEADAQIDLKVNRRDVRVDAGARNLTGAFDHVRFTLGYSNYRHDEIEIEDGEEALGTRFTNKTMTLRGELDQARRGRLTGKLGAEYFFRDYLAEGAEALAPATTQNAFSAFAYEEVDFGRQRLQFGGRVERNAYSPEGGEKLTFLGVSGSVGLHTEAGRFGAFVVNLTGASRAPALEELYNFGPHPGNLAFEVGNASLDVERAFGLDVSLRSRAPKARAEVSAFVYTIKNFVFLDVTDEIEDGLRVSNYTQGDSRFMGMEASGAFDLGRSAKLHAGLSFVNARLTTTDEPLPRIPAFRGSVELDLPIRGLTVSPQVVFTADQHRVFRDETSTAGSTVLNFSATYLIARGHATHTFALKAYNLTNEEYRLHTSFIKHLAAEMGRGVKVTYAVKFF